MLALSKTYHRRVTRRLVMMALAHVAYVATATVATAESAREWLQRSQGARFPAQDMCARFAMRIEREGQDTRLREGVILRQTRGPGLADRLVVFRSPERLKGLALLSKDRPDEPADQWLYLPRFKRVRRVAVHSMTDGYAGSNFTYSDFGRVRIEAGKHRLKGETTIRGQRCVVVETRSEDPTLPYARLVSVIDREEALPLRLEYYDGAGHLTRVGRFKDITKIAGWSTPLTVSMTSNGGAERSIIHFLGVHYDIGLDPSLFTTDRLENSGSLEISLACDSPSATDARPDSKEH